MAKVTVAGQDPVKFIGGIVFAIVSIGVFIHRIPHQQYVEVHEDKPRVRPPKDGAVVPGAAAAKAAMAAPAAKAAAAAPAPAVKAAPKTPDAPARASGVPGTVIASASVPLEEACSAESGLLCYQVPPRRLRGCLAPYDDALTKTCRDAVTSPVAETFGR